MLNFKELGLCPDCERKVREYAAKRRLRQKETRDLLARGGEVSLKRLLLSQCSARAQNALEGWSAYRLLTTSKSDFLNHVTGFGQDSFRELVEAMERHGLHLQMTEDELRELGVTKP